MNTALPPVGPGDHVRGPADAPVTLIEYGDFECPHCALGAEAVEALRERCGDRLRVVWRHFPLAQVHPHAIAAALASEAAAREGRFWEMHALLFRANGQLTLPDLQTWGAMLGLSAGAIATALDDAALRAAVRAQFAAGAAAGVSGTPTFFVNGERVSGWADGGLERAVLRALEEQAE